MNKERLEEIAYNVGVSLDGEKALMSSDDYDFLYNYALEQAERVEKLEIIIEQDNRQEVVESMYEKNERLKERVQELEEDINRLNGALHYQLTQENIRNEENRKLRKQNKRYREVVTQAISDLENECLWDALVKLKALEESE